MSKNITIQEGGTAKQLTVDKLKTNLVGGGACLWVPEDETSLGTKHISENGTYKASDDGYYGYSEVTVNGIGIAVGKDSDGDSAYASTDPETGVIGIKKLPSSIRITTPPTKLSYIDGESIDYGGMVVKAYLESGEPWTDAGHRDGIIPISELTLPVTHADYSSASHSSKVQTDFNIEPNPFDMGSLDYVDAWSVGGGAYRRSESHVSFTGAIKNLSGNLGDRIIASSSPFSGTSQLLVYGVSKEEAEGKTTAEIAHSNLGTFIYSNESVVQNNNSFTYEGKTVYYSASGMPLNGYFDIGFITTGITEQIAWSMVYGDITESGVQDIPVQYAIAESGEILSDGFSIHVDQIMGGATGGGGQAGDTGTGRND